jgi:hypothetical protein
VDEDEEVKKYKPQRYFPDTYLDSPILITKRLKWMCLDDLTVPSDPKTMAERTLRDIKQTGLIGSEYEIVDPDQYSVHYNFDWPSTLDTEVEDSLSVAHKIYSTVQKALKTHWDVDLPVLPLAIPPQARHWLDKWSYMDSLVDKFAAVCAATGPNVVPMTLGDHTTVTATKDVWWLDCKGHGKYLYTYDQILMLKDLFYSRAQAYIAAAVIYPKNPEIMDAIAATCQWHEKCLTRYRNKGFEILKQTEALAKAYLSEMTDDVFGSDGPYGRMLEKVRAKERDMKATTFLADEFDLVLRKCSDVVTIVEIYGLLKISGHPLIDPILGGRSSAKLAKKPSSVYYKDAQEIDWEFKRIILENYVKKHGAWPPLEFSPGVRRSKLRRLYKRQYRALNRGSYPRSDWQYCRFGKIEEFDYSPNYLDLMDDKAISLYRSNLAATWDHDVRPKSHRRLLLEMITRKVISIADVVKLIVRREVPMDWFVVCVHPKEREFKEAPRMFSMLVFEIRMFFALTEANLADRIFPYLPQQTMTESRLTIGRRFLNMTRPITNEDSLRMFYELDLSSWNLLWRDSTVNPVAHTLNDMFGVVGIFDFCHEFFSKCVIIVRVNDLRPEGIEQMSPPASELAWYDHLGGFEGICQKLWTICTYCMVALALTGLALSYQLTGQADNQIMSIVTARNRHESKKVTLSRLRDQITSRLTNRCLRTGQILKPEECLESTSVITYSKDVYVAGVYRPTALKFHSRLFPHSSEVFPSVRTNIGAIFSTAVSGAEKSTNPMSSYFLACFYSAMYLNRLSYGRGPYGRIIQIFRGKLKDRFPDFLRFCLTLPSEAGGLPVIPFVGFMYKGGSDPLGKSLSAMTVLGLHSNDRLANRMLAQMSSDSIYNQEPRLGQLFMDPFSIPLDKPATSVDGIASETIAALRGQIVTTDIRQLVEADTVNYLDELVDVLQLCKPMNPLMIRDILDCSVAGVTDTVSRMFVATRTLQNVVRELGIPVVEKILHLEEKGLNYYLNRFLMLPSSPAQPKTAYQLTTEARNRWTAKIDNEIVGLTTYQPLDFHLTWGPQSLGHIGVNGVLVSTTDPLDTRGPYDPYVGSKTREKRSEHGYKIVGTDTASRAMRKLQLITSQTGDDAMFKAILDAVGWSRTNTTLSAVSDLLPGVSGGTLSHRYAARAGHQDAFNIGSPNFATHCVVSSDNAGDLSGGLVDYPVMLQEPLLMVLWALQAKYQTSGEDFIAVTLDVGRLPMVPLPSVDIRGPDKLNLRVLRFDTNVLAFNPVLKLERVSGAIAHRALPITDIFKPTSELRRHVLESYFKVKIRQSSVGRQIADGAYQHFQGDVLDIAEVASNGLYNIAMAISFVIADEAISNFMMTTVMKRDRWRVEPFIYALVGPCVQTLSPLFGHPLLAADPMVKKLYLYDNPMYAGGTTIAHNRMCGFIVGQALENLRGYVQRYNHRTIGIFTSDNPRVASETLMTCLLSDLYIWLKQAAIDDKFVHDLLANQLIPAYRHEWDEDSRVDIIVQATMNMERHFRLRDPTISSTLKLYRRSRAIGYKVTTKDMLKSTRNIDDWGLPLSIPVPQYKHLKLPADLPASRWIGPTKITSSITGVRSLSTDPATQLDLLISTYNRNLGRFSLASGSAHHTWALFAPLFVRKPVIVIGSGMGAVSRVALDAGCPFVHGIDLRTTIPMRAHRFRYYKPPLVMSCEYNDRYEQMMESFTTSGDWMNPDVSSLVLNYDPGDATIVIDIQAGKNRYGLQVLAPLIGRKFRGLVVLRLYLTSHESELIVGDLIASGAEFTWYDLESMQNTHTCVCVLTRLPTVLRIGITLSTVQRPEAVSIPIVPTRAQSRSDYCIALSDGVYNVIYTDELTTQEDVATMLDVLIGEARGDYDSRLSYDHWTRLLRAKVIIEWSMMLENKRIAELEEWLKTGWAKSTIAGVVESVRADYSLARHAVSYGARIIRV